MKATRAAALVALVAVLLPAPAAAQLQLLGADSLGLELGGYVRALTAVHDASFRLPGQPERTGIHGEVVRLKWWGTLGPRVSVEVHQRLQVRVSSAAADASLAGFGVSVVPGRALDLESTLLREERLRAWHDLDRLSVTVLTAWADVTVGRQAVTWGGAALFPVADLWTQFSPFELDTEEKPGVDAVRALAYPADGLEVDAVVAFRERAEDLSAGVRAVLSLADADVSAAVGKFWDEAMVAGGVTWLLETARLRAEAALPWDLDGDTLQRPRITVGADWLGARLTVSGEYHFNGLGAVDAPGYAAVAAAEPFRRGESYFLGRHYAGAAVGWSPDEENRLRLDGSALVNLGDPSASITAVGSYDFGQSTSVSVGVLETAGDAPAVSPVPALRSEYGAYGRLLFTRLSVYF